MECESNTTYNPGFDDSEDMYRIVYMLLFPLAFLILLFNIPVVLAIIANSKLHQPTFYLVASLAMADLCIGITVLGKIIDPSENSMNLCLVRFAFLTMPTSASAISMFWIAVDRYVAIENALLYELTVTPFRAFLAIISTWIYSFIVGFSILYWNDVTSSDGIERCSFLYIVNTSYMWFLFVTVVVIPSTAIIVIYTKIFIVHRRLIRKITDIEHNVKKHKISCISTNSLFEISYGGGESMFKNMSSDYKQYTRDLESEPDPESSVTVKGYAPNNINVNKHNSIIAWGDISNSDPQCTSISDGVLLNSNTSCTNNMLTTIHNGESITQDTNGHGDCGAVESNPGDTHDTLHQTVIDEKYSSVVLGTDINYTRIIEDHRNGSTPASKNNAFNGVGQLNGSADYDVFLSDTDISKSYMQNNGLLNGLKYSTTNSQVSDQKVNLKDNEVDNTDATMYETVCPMHDGDVNNTSTTDAIGSQLTIYHDFTESGCIGPSNQRKLKRKKGVLHSLKKTVSVTSENNPNFFKTLKAVKNLAIILGCFIATWGPFIIANIVYTAKLNINGYPDCELRDLIGSYFHYWKLCNSFMNPLVYAARHEQFRETARAFKRKLYNTINLICSEVCSNTDQSRSSSMC